MLILKLAALTCVVYLFISILAQAVEIAVIRLMGGITYSVFVLAVFFGLVWITSFIIAWGILSGRTG
jgi:hypothetical protein